MAERSYESGEIRVLWNSERCIHTAICLNALPEVFDIQARPWVAVDAAHADEIAQAVEKCPTGALTYERLDGAPDEQPADPTTIVPWPNGPLFVRGNLAVRDAKGDLFDSGPRMALCRCGHSQNQPFCDLSHRSVGFKDAPRARSPDRSEAQSPREITPQPGP